MLYLIHPAYIGRNGTLQVQLNKVRKNIYKIRQAEMIANFFKIDFSEGTGSPAVAALTFRRLKAEKHRKLTEPKHKSTQTYCPVTMSKLLSRKWKNDIMEKDVAGAQM